MDLITGNITITVDNHVDNIISLQQDTLTQLKVKVMNKPRSGIASVGGKNIIFGSLEKRFMQNIMTTYVK